MKSRSWLDHVERESRHLLIFAHFTSFLDPTVRLIRVEFTCLVWSACPREVMSIFVIATVFHSSGLTLTRYSAWVEYSSAGDKKVIAKVCHAQTRKAIFCLITDDHLTGN